MIKRKNTLKAIKTRMIKHGNDKIRKEINESE